jgi:uncharacterized protein (TIGR02246 family)
MRQSVLALGVVLVALTLLSCAQQTMPVAEETASTEADVDAIRDFYQRYDATVTAGDREDWMELLANDIVWMVPEQEALVGEDAVRTRVDPMFNDLDMGHITSLEEIEVCDKWAYALGKYTFSATPKAGGETSEEIGKFMAVLNRQSDGSWKMSRNIWNPNHPTE